jgi:beta-lactamase superfamily II metal-dependent hydrolase
LIAIISRLSLVSEKLCIPGSPLGLGLPFFVILAISFYRSEHAAKIWTGLYFSFLLTGLFHPFAEVTFINIGQGDSILIREPFNLNNVLIDTGKPSQYSALKAMLDGKGIRRIGTMFITHMDSDHSGNMEVIPKEYRVGRIITEHEGTTLSGSLVFHDLNSIVSEDENQSSIVLVFEMNGLKFVMPGDADQIAEEAIVRRFGNLKCDVLKLSHHGSKTGSCDLFLDTLKPRLGIVSAGAAHIYRHPSDETVQRLLKRHIPYLNTNDHGDISIFMIGPLALLLTSDGIVDVLSTGWQG